MISMTRLAFGEEGYFWEFLGLLTKKIYSHIFKEGIISLKLYRAFIIDLEFLF